MNQHLLPYQIALYVYNLIHHKIVGSLIIFNKSNNVRDTYVLIEFMYLENFINYTFNWMVNACDFVPVEIIKEITEITSQSLKLAYSWLLDKLEEVFKLLMHYAQKVLLKAKFL